MKSLLYILFIMLGLPALLLAQENKTLVLDISSLMPGDTLFEFGNDRFNEMEIKNAFPFEKYYFSVYKERIIPDPLVLPKDPSGFATKTLMVADPCYEINQIMKELLKLTDKQEVIKNNYTEVTIDERIKELETARINYKDCFDQNDAFKLYLDSLIDGFSQEKKQKIDIGYNEKVTISVYTADKKKIWTWVFKGDEQGKWITSYGFGFSFKALESPTYYTAVNSDSTTFEIKKAKNPEPLDLNYVPAVFFSYFPGKNHNKRWNCSVTAGLGFDLAAPVIYFGGNLMYHYNIGLSAGFSLQQQSKLKNQYEDDKTVSEYLDSDQLHDKVYRPNFYFAIHFRLGENPFKKE